MYTRCVFCEGVARSFFTESSLGITEARKELWIQRLKEQMGHVQNLLLKRFQANCIFGSILCVESDSYIKLSQSSKDCQNPTPNPQQPQTGGEQWPLVLTGLW